MKKQFAISIILLLFVSPLVAQNTMNVFTYNIRMNTASDGINAWPNRKTEVIDLLKRHQADIFSVQEALYNQMVDLREGMPEFRSVGVGRDDGKDKGEFSAIFYLTDRYQLLSSGTFWLSPTPDVPSKGWDAALNRVCSWANLKDKVTGKKFYVYNTHFDHIGVQARAESAKLIIEKIKEVAGNKTPVILTGDFNLTPNEVPIKLITDYLSDSKDTSKTPHEGPEGTFNGFKFDSKLENRIDYIFVNKKVEVLSHCTLTDSKDNRYPSDHLPVVATLLLK